MTITLANSRHINSKRTQNMCGIRLQTRVLKKIYIYKNDFIGFKSTLFDDVQKADARDEIIREEE